MVHCLNCEQPVSGNFCTECGQKASTHRYSVKNFIVHDLMQGVWGLDKGLLFTMKELFTRPGHSVREFINGRRATYFNFISLLLFILGLGIFVNEFSTIKLSDLSPEQSRKLMSGLEEFSAKYPKLVMLMSIPLSSLFSRVWFHRAKLNGTEHIVMNTYKASAELTLELLFNIITIFYLNKTGLSVLYNILLLAITGYGIWFYVQFFSGYGYSRAGLIFRSLMIPVTSFLFFSLLGILSEIFVHAGF